MYCSSCGRSLTENLNYCNNCGARNEKNAAVVGNSSSKILGIAGAFIGMVGLVGFVEVLKILLRSPLDTWAIVVILIAYLVVVFSMFAVLIGHVWKHSGDIRIKSKDRESKDNMPNTFRGVTTAQLSEPSGFPASVTEHTTRTLENVPLKRN